MDQYTDEQVDNTYLMQPYMRKWLWKNWFYMFLKEDLMNDMKI